MSKFYKIFFLIISTLLLFNFSVLSAQPKKHKMTSKTNIPVQPKEETTFKYSIDEPAEDSLKNQETDKSLMIKADGVKKKASSSGMDTVVTYSAKDTVKFTLKKKRMRMRGDAKLNLGAQKMEAEVIELDFQKNLLEASGIVDSNNRGYGYPKFDDKGEAFAGSRILYNFKTQQGTISLGETELDEGFYFGSKIKRVSKDDLFIQDGKYTTCDAPHPHFHFGSPKMKVIAKDRVFLDPLIFYVEDMPIFMVPFGLFFPSQGGRQSGVIIPSFFFSQNRGVTFQEFGFYLALSDYYDTKFTGDFYSKGGFLAKNFTQWRLTDVMSGSLNLEYGKTRFNPDDPYDENYRIDLRHNHTINPFEKIDVNLSYQTQNFGQNVYIDPIQRSKQNASSRASYSNSDLFGSNFSIVYSRNQNLSNNDFNHYSDITFNWPSLQPLKSIVSPQSWIPNWVREIDFRYGLKAHWEESDYQKERDIFVNEDSSYSEQYQDFSNQRRIMHTPSISISPKLGYFTITPSISFSMNNYFKKLNRYYDEQDSVVRETMESGFFSEYNYSFGVGVQTKLFGVVEPDILGLKAFRHTIMPNLSYRYTPDLSGGQYDFYGRYVDSTGEEQVYSRFQYDGGGLASRSKSQTLSYSLNNVFDAKIAAGDSIEKVTLLNLDFNGSYDFEKDSLGFSDIGVTIRTPDIGMLKLSGYAGFSLYDEEFQELSQNYARVNRFLFAEGKGLARLTSFSFTASTSISSDGTIGDARTEESGEEEDKDSSGLGDRFNQRMNAQYDEPDFYGDRSHGYAPMNVPWKLNLGLNFTYREPTLKNISRTINLQMGFNFRLTDSWSFNTSAQYDFVNMQFVSPSINITKDMHCWNLSMNWYPTGYSRGFYLRFGIKAQQLQDLKIEKRSHSNYY